MLLRFSYKTDNKDDYYDKNNPGNKPDKNNNQPL
jgi:hypothetical protein